MRRSDYIALSRAEAQKVLSPEDFTKLIEAIRTSTLTFFTYKDKAGIKKIYKPVRPIEFIFTPGWSGPPAEGAVYLWAFHPLDKEKHSFRADRITDVNRWPTIIESLIDPTKNNYFWQGITASIETIIIE